MNGSTNIGGLIGDNQGKLTAGYNTGVISTGSSTNVGGIAGSNSGTMDQVFTNVMTENGQDQTITGKENVGGIVGNNGTNGKISNAYTAKETTVKGTTSGLIAGTNGGTISNVYGTNEDQLVGNGTKATNGYGMSNASKDYNGFDFTNTWKIYEDHTNPLLKVFLTKANIKEDALKNLTYNGENQLDIKKLISDKTLTNQKDANFADYTHSSSLLQSNASKNAGIYTKWLWSAQIDKNTDGKAFDPNNLGYDFSVTDVAVGKKQLLVRADDQIITVGQTPNYTGQIIGLANGDSEANLGRLTYGIIDLNYERTPGMYNGMIQSIWQGRYGTVPDAYTKNYDVSYQWGNLIVKPVDASQFDYLFYDTPWDRPRNFRERRAELHFVDGGVHVG